MSGDADRERLRHVYAEQSDGELLKLHEERHGLTTAAKEALAEVMNQRGLEALEEAEELREAPRQGTDLERARTEIEPDEAFLYSFRDTFQLAEAIRLLEAEDIAVRAFDRSGYKWEGLRSRNEVDICLIVKRTDERSAIQLLKEHLHLFPGKEVEGEPDLAFPSPHDLTPLFMCNRADALSVVQALSETGISFFWRDGREDSGLPDEETISIEVQASQQERAREAVEDWLAASI